MSIRSFRLPFNLAGIPLYVDVSFLLVLPLMIWAATQNLAAIAGHPMLGLDPAGFVGPTALLLGVISALGLFTSIVLHELGHSITARRYGVRVRRITLWFLGGVAELEGMPKQRGAEAVVGIAGPIVSFVLAAIFGGLAAFVGPQQAPSVYLVCVYLAAINMMLGLFNLLPALPMDGGRILRSLLALKLGQSRATAIAGNVAKVLAVGMGVLGLMSFNVMLILLAVFVYTSARSETQHTVVTDMLRGLGVADLMNRDVRSIPAAVTVGDLSRYILTQHHPNFPVVDDRGRLIGTIGVEQLRAAHPDMLVWQAMNPEAHTIREHAAALDAFNEMGRYQVGRLIVLNDAGDMVGILTQADLMRAIQVRMMGFQVVPGTTAGSGHPQPPQQSETPVTVHRAPDSPFWPYPPQRPVGYTRHHPWSSES